MNYLFLSDFGIPASTSFKIAFVSVTAAYVISMIILFVFYKKAASRIPRKKEKLSEEKISVRSKRHKRRQP